MKPSEGTEARSSRASMTPELALVDLELAAEAQSSLPQSDDTIARIELLVRASRIAAARGAVAVPSAPVRRPPASPPTRRRLRAKRRTAALAGGAVVAVFVAALLIGVRIDLHGSPAGADTASIGVPPVPRPETAPARTETTPAHTETAPADTAPAPARPSPPPRPPAAPSAIARRFVWAPVAGASGYRVQFFRGSTLVFSAQTPRAELTIPRSWTLQGKRKTLRPGDYQWYVWPLHNGLRAATAVVQARLTVPRR